VEPQWRFLHWLHQEKNNQIKNFSRELKKCTASLTIKKKKKKKKSGQKLVNPVVELGKS
jgi:hypothetical protein